MSIEELKDFSGFENYTDEMVEETIKTLETLSILFYELNQKFIVRKLSLDTILAWESLNSIS